MRSRIAIAVGALTVGLMVTAIAWAAQDAESTVNIGLAESQSTTLPVDDAGVIVLSRTDGQLQIVTATPNTGFTAEVEVAAGREVEADFRGNGRRVQFNAQLEDGVVRVRIRSEASDDSGSTSSTGVTTNSNTAVTSTTGPSTSTSVTGSTPVTPTTTGASNGSGTLVLSDGQVSTVRVADAGSVQLRRSGGSLTILSTQANAGWAVEIEVSTGREVEGDFRSGARRIKFNFELEDGVVRIRIETEASASDDSNSSDDSSGSDDSNGSGDSSGSGDSNTSTTATTNTTGTSAGSSALPAGSVTYTLDGAGTVTVVFANGGMSIGSINPAAGWTIGNSEQGSDEIRVELTNGSSEAELRVRINNGQVEVEIDSKSS